MMASLVSLIPLILTLLLALFLRRTLVALGVGIVSGAILINHFQPLTTAQYLLEKAVVQLYSDGQWQAWHLNVIIAMVMLGVITQLLARGNAVSQFGDWLHQRIHSQRQARIGVVLLGWLVFIDGIFSCLAVGHVCQPLSERYGISKPQLAYFVDSNASPLCALLPFSSWGPYVMALLASVSYIGMSPLAAFIDIAQMNFYAISTLVISAVVAWVGLGFSTTAAALTPAVSGRATPWLLAAPMLTLLLGAMALILYSGASQIGGSDVTAWFSNADIGAAMRDASLIATLVTLVVLNINGRSMTLLLNDWFHGMKTMIFALSILMLTWMIGAVIQDLGVASLLASWADRFLAPQLLVAGLFLLCAVMAFATGSSWGTFAIMIPIGAEIAHTVEPSMMLAALSAVMAGSVFGDHCSPISDTSVLSATSSGCTPHEHVISQLPFALVAAVSALIGFQVLNLGGGYLFALSLALISAIAVLMLWQWRRVALGDNQSHSPS